MLVSSLRIPVPTVIELYNVLPTDALDEATKWYRPEYATNLLRKVQLQLIVGGGNDLNDCNVDTQALHNDHHANIINERCLFNSAGRQQCMSVVQPRWYNLHEHLTDLSMDDYETMKIRIYLSQPSLEQNQNNSEDDCRVDSNKNNTIQEVTYTKLVEIPAHPSHLVRIARKPARLPVNAIIVHYSDQSIRVTDQLYRLLRDSGQDDAIIVSSIKNNHNTNVKDDFGRFQDDVFRTLDQVTPASNFRVNSDDANSNNKSLLEATTIATINTESTVNKVDDLSLSSQTLPYLKEQLDDEIKNLEVLIKLEQQALMEDVENLVQDKSELENTPTYIKTKHTITSEVIKCLREEKSNISKHQFFVTAQKISLMEDLSRVYIININNNKHTIFGLEIPADMFSGLVPDEELSAALGYLCHLLHMMSKYLSIRTRYRLTCYASKSAIQDDWGHVYPLFQTRGVDREQLERGLKLLHNVADCLALSQGVIFEAEKTHILEKTRRIIEKVIHG